MANKLEKFRQRAVKGVASGGLSEIDRATGNKMGINKGLDDVGKQIAGWNPYSKENNKAAQIPQADQNALTMLQQMPKFEEAGFTMNAVNTANADQVRANQAIVAARLQQQALGQGPSIAEQQMRAGQEAALLQNRAALASTRGGANPLAARSAIQANQAAQLQLAQQAGIARLQEQQAAAQQYGSLSSDMRMRDLAQEEMKANQQNAFNQLRQNYMNQGLSVAQANQQAMLEFERIRLGQGTAQAQADAAANQARMGKISGLFNSIGQAGMTYATGGFSQPGGILAPSGSTALASGAGAVNPQGQIMSGPQKKDGSF